MINMILDDANDRMQKAIEAYQRDLATVRTGRATPAMLDRVMVNYYGSPTPINQMAGVSVVEGRQLVIKPYDKSALKDIEHGIYEADLGLTPQNDGEIIRITVPALTEERRKEFAKNVWKFAEHAKVAVRNIRRDANDEIKKCDGSEDEIKDGQNRVQKLTDKFVKEIDEIGKAKEKDITLKITQKVEELLKKKGAKVTMTRVKDVDVYGVNATDAQELQARVDVAENSAADLFISLHINASVNKNVGGFSSYYYPKTSHDARVAAAIQKRMTNNFGLDDLGIRQANFYVNKRSSMPSALIEMAFITNAKEEKLLNSNWFQSKLAKAIADGIEDYFK